MNTDVMFYIALAILVLIIARSLLVMMELHYHNKERCRECGGTLWDDSYSGNVCCSNPDCAVNDLRFYPKTKG